MSTKPTVAQHKRTLSSFQAQAPSSDAFTSSAHDRTNKRSRIEGSDSGEPLSDKSSPGAAWMVEMIDRMTAQYREAIMAASVIVRYEAYRNRIGMRDERIQLSLVPRHIEWYMAQNATASSPSQALPSIPAITLEQPGPLAPIIREHAATPIPLSSASFLSFDPPSQRESAGERQPEVEVPALQLPQPSISQAFLNDQVPPPDHQNTLDLSNLGLSELTAILAGYLRGDDWQLAERLEFWKLSPMQKYRRIVCEALRSARVDEESRCVWLSPSRLGTQPERNKLEIQRFGVEHFRKRELSHGRHGNHIGVLFSAQAEIAFVHISHSNMDTNLAATTAA
ncbi:MAG: hypothetical protein TREMPRED_003656 [Tremellales sp. Tagirdzhanova-0007]|nr:MAG: hypothetical protein TREMPRED_003656 [Tremellales sp. Tagirdzhanova-0007]